MELSQHLHLLIAIVSGYLFVLFGWWWAQAGESTHIYKITFFLMLGICFTHTGAWYMYYTSANTDISIIHLNNWWWPYRQLLVLIPLIWYAVHITYKSCFGKKYFRRINDL